MVRRLASVFVSVFVSVVVSVFAVAVVLVAALGIAAPVSAETGPTTSMTVSRLPGTTLEAQQRDDGTTSQAPVLIVSGVAAAVAIGAGGLLLKRRQG